MRDVGNGDELRQVGIFGVHDHELLREGVESPEKVPEVRDGVAWKVDWVLV